MTHKQKKGFNQMMSILMLGLISAGSGVGVATFAADQQTGLTQTTGGAGLRESLTIENVGLDTSVPTSNVVIVVRNVGVVDLEVAAIYMNGTNINLTSFTDEDDSPSVTNLSPGESGTVTFSTGGLLVTGTVQSFKAVTDGGGVTTTTVTVS